ncbi:L-arabinose 1-dehydrogenase (NAD(P)(+)) [Candidatus Gugararchaeum adminiculabundum]|nr:L-arabinose 1-dehydrogenase (NAD(P)(+)) [Candidatus Gugararchaeum adminiculabundum]
MLNDRKILVTGGAGAIGSNLVRALVSQGKGNRVTVIDDESEGTFENIRDVAGKITYLKGDIRDAGILDKAFSQNFDYIFHLAAAFANEKSVENPKFDCDVNIGGTIKLLERARKAGKDGKSVERFVYASSSSCYGQQEKLPLSEEASMNPSTPYAVSKLAGEQYAHLYSKLYGMPTASIRYFNSFGPGERPGKYRNVIPNFFSLALKGEPLTITGTGEETRDFTYISDVVDCTILAAEKKAAIGEVFNCSYGKERKIIDVANSINKICGNKAGVVFKERRSWDNVTRRGASVEKAKKLLGFSPKVDFEQGIVKTFEWFKKIKI